MSFIEDKKFYRFGNHKNRCFICLKYRKTGKQLGLYKMPKTIHWQEKWLRAVDLDIEIAMKYEIKICSHHFLPEDFEVRNTKTLLKFGAIPTLKMERKDYIYELPKFNTKKFMEISNRKLQNMDHEIEKLKNRLGLTVNKVPAVMTAVPAPSADKTVFKIKPYVAFDDDESIEKSIAGKGDDLLVDVTRENGDSNVSFEEKYVPPDPLAMDVDIESIPVNKIEKIPSIAQNPEKNQIVKIVPPKVNAAGPSGITQIFPIQSQSLIDPRNCLQVVYNAPMKIQEIRTIPELPPSPSTIINPDPSMTRPCIECRNKDALSRKVERYKVKFLEHKKIINNLQRSMKRKDKRVEIMKKKLEIFGSLKGKLKIDNLNDVEIIYETVDDVSGEIREEIVSMGTNRKRRKVAGKKVDSEEKKDEAGEDNASQEEAAVDNEACIEEIDEGQEELSGDIENQDQEENDDSKLEFEQEIDDLIDYEEPIELEDHKLGYSNLEIQVLNENWES